MLSLGIILVLLGLIFKNLLLMTLATSIFIYLVVGLFTNRISQIKPERQLSHEKIFEDGTVKAEIRLMNEGGKTGFLEVRDRLPRQIQLKSGSNYTYLNLKPKAITKLRYTVKLPLKGVYNIGPVTIRSHDTFNLYYQELEIDYVSLLTVFPQTRDVKELYIKSRQPKLYPGEMRVKMPGPGAEFFSIREYMPGDPFKMINWKAYASTGTLLVNEKERESVSDVTIVFDSRNTSGYGMDSDNPNLYGARAAATLANFFIKRRDTVQLIVYSDKVHTFKKGGGKKQLYEILTGLSGASPKGNIPLGGIVEVALPYLPRMSPVIIISSLDEDDTLREAVSHMMVLEFDVTIIAPNSIEFEIMAREKQKKRSTVDPVAYDVIKMEREIMLQELRGYGVKVLDWKPSIPLTQILLEARNV